MKICQVVRPLVATNRIALMEHKHLQVVLDGSSKAVAVDPVGAKPGDWVLCVGSSAAREAAGSKTYPSDLTIVGIIDYWPHPDDVAAAEEAERKAAAEQQAADADEKGDNESKDQGAQQAAAASSQPSAAGDAPKPSGA